MSAAVANLGLVYLANCVYECACARYGLYARLVIRVAEQIRALVVKAEGSDTGAICSIKDKLIALFKEHKLGCYRKVHPKKMGVHMWNATSRASCRSTRTT